MHKVKILNAKGKNQNSSFFYDGTIAECGKYCVIATGEIRIWCSKHEELCYDCKPRNCCCLKEPMTDADLEFEEDEFYYVYNNWFEILGIKQEDDPCIDIIDTYDEAIDTLYKLANDIEL